MLDELALKRKQRAAHIEAVRQLKDVYRRGAVECAEERSASVESDALCTSIIPDGRSSAHSPLTNDEVT